MTDLRILDNGGETIDRYTVIIDNSVFGMSDDPLSPQGVNLYCGELEEFPEGLDHCGEDITDRYFHLPHRVFVAIHQRVNQE